MKSVYLLHHAVKVALLAGLLRVASLSPPPEFLASPSEKVSLLSHQHLDDPVQRLLRRGWTGSCFGSWTPGYAMAADDAMASESPRSCGLCLPDPARQSLRSAESPCLTGSAPGAKKPRRELSLQWQPLPSTEL